MEPSYSAPGVGFQWACSPGGFPVSVCLRRVLGTAAHQRAACLLWVQPGQRVCCLVSRLRHLCGTLAPGLPGLGPAVGLALRVRGYWLPPHEPVALLRPGDHLELVPIVQSQLGGGTGANPAAPGQALGPEGAAELERYLKRALGLLDRGEAEGGPPPPARRRQYRTRVFRRRRAPAPAPAPDPASAPARRDRSRHSRRL